MKTRVIGIDCGFSSSVIEIPFNEKYEVAVGEEVIFRDADNKEEYGLVKYLDRETEDNSKVLFTSAILRKATSNDIQKVENHMTLAKEALEICRELVAEFKLDMNVFRVGYSLDGAKIHFTFTAEDRVDFRDLVKALAKALKKQINLKQVGPRDKAAAMGGYGKCGRPLCCNTWLGKLDTINMEMVRVQALESKGSSKLSGVCGKLLCCLKYEVESYKDLRKAMPKIGQKVQIKNRGASAATVIALDILNQKLKVVFPEGEYVVVDNKEVVKF